jgi:hypothetical protein
LEREGLDVEGHAAEVHAMLRASSLVDPPIFAWERHERGAADRTIGNRTDDDVSEIRLVDLLTRECRRPEPLVPLLLLQHPVEEVEARRVSGRGVERRCVVARELLGVVTIDVG